MDVLRLLVFALSAAVVCSKVHKLSNGDIVKCIKIHDQPSVTDASTIQMRPSIAHQQVFGEAAAKPSKLQLFAHEVGSCKKGEIPVLSYSHNNGSIHANVYKKKQSGHALEQKLESPQASGVETHQHAALYTTGNFLGFSTTINIWQPYVEKASEFSLSQLWLISSRSSPNTPRNTIEAGWQVYPDLYRGNQTRLFVYWTADGYQRTGCYNLKCPGFVQVSNQFVVGGALVPVSVAGSTQVEAEFLVFQDQQTKNWWLRIAGVYVGYWLNSVIPDFYNGATEVACGGEIYYNKVNGVRHTKTQMGSGQFPSAGFRYAAYHRLVQVVQRDFRLYNAANLRPWSVVAPGCYNVGYPGYNDTNWGTYFFFGGPGYNGGSCVV